MMELRSGQSRKKMMECAVSERSLPHDETPWYFMQICYDALDSKAHEDTKIHDYSAILSWCVSILNDSQTACLMLKEVCAKDWRVTFEDLDGGEYCIDIVQKLLILDNHTLMPLALGESNYFRNMTLIAMVKALRDIWQEKRHSGFDTLYAPEYVLLMERVRAADLDALTILVAWELRCDGYTEAWKHIIGSDIGDMAMVFSNYLDRHISAQSSRQALRAAFKQWFSCADRLYACDHDALDYMDDVLVTCEQAQPFGSKKPSKIKVETLSCLPDKTAYLQGLGAEILNNPTYVSVDHSINQTHLFHIMHDLEAVIVENVPFRDADLARRIFPAD